VSEARAHGVARAFVAVRPPAPVLNAIDAAAATARDDAPRLRWVPRDQWHLTLQFLGPVADVDALVRSLEGLRQRAPFRARAGGAGAFKSARRGTVLWLGVREGGDDLVALAGEATRLTASIGFESEDRPFRPHLTLARASTPTDLRDAVAVLEMVGDVGPAWTVDHVVVVESDTRPEGAVHREIARVALSDGSAEPR
jgi:RNA 2',3'-cyclic 3'-phosphodiesterase